MFIISPNSQISQICSTSYLSPLFSLSFSQPISSYASHRSLRVTFSKNFSTSKIEHWSTWSVALSAQQPSTRKVQKPWWHKLDKKSALYIFQHFKRENELLLQVIHLLCPLKANRWGNGFQWHHEKMAFTSKHQSLLQVTESRALDQCNF